MSKLPLSDHDFLEKALDVMFENIDDALKEIFKEIMGSPLESLDVNVNPTEFAMMVYCQSVVFLDYALRAQETYSLLTGNAEKCKRDAEAYLEEICSRVKDIDSKQKAFLDNLNTLKKKSFH